MRLRFTTGSLDDIEALYAFVAEANPAAAENLLRNVDHAITGLLLHPERGRRGRVRDTRELVVAGTPNLVAHALSGDEIQILAAIHGARAWPTSC